MMTSPALTIIAILLSVTVVASVQGVEEKEPTATKNNGSQHLRAHKLLVVDPKSVSHKIFKSKNQISTCQPTCRITEESLPEYIQDPRLEYGPENSGGVLFLLGAPYTGTTAMHWLLGTSDNVSLLGENTMKPEKEGWHKTGLKKQHRTERWDGELAWVDWNNLAEQYGTFWDKSKPLLVENSPPEIQRPDALMEAFTPIYGRVKFLLLIRGECGSNAPQEMPYRSDMYKNVLDKYPENTFVLRYEDICLRWDKVHADLVKWEPLLADIDINFIDESPPDEMATKGSRRRLSGHQHKQVSVKEYCDSKLQGWADGLQCERCESEIDFMKLWGYGDTLNPKEEGCSN